jgi:sarcosine oxidase subunit beta
MSRWKRTADIAIIGGGIMGCSTAYHLAKRGQKEVVLLEKDLLAQASTGLSVGGIRLQFSHPANIHLSQETLRLFEHFEEEFNVDIGFRQVGYLFIAQKKNTWGDFLNSVKVQRQFNIPVEVLSPQEIKRRWPYLEVTDIQGGTFCSKDGYADPYNVAMALANRARTMGVCIVEKTKVTGIRVENSRIKGVETAKGLISAPIVVNAAGPWGGEVARMAGLECPVRPFRRQVFMTKAFDAIPKPVPMIIDFDTLFYFRGEGPGLLMGMSDLDEPPSFNINVDRNFLEGVIEKAVHRAPVLEKAKILRGWGGLYAITPDENPIIGMTPQAEGFLCAIGFSGHGFQHGPVVGRILSELILDGHTDFDLAPFAHDRFGKTKEEGEKRAV